MYAATGESEWYADGLRLTELIPELFADPDGGFFTPDQLNRAADGEHHHAAEILILDGREVGRGVDSFTNDQECSTRGGTTDDAHRLSIRLGEAVDRWVGADEGDVERTAEERLDHLASRVEAAQLQVGVADGLLEDAATNPDDAGGVSHIRKESEAQSVTLSRVGIGSSGGW